MTADRSEVSVTAHGAQATLRSEIADLLSIGRSHDVDVTANTVHAAYLQYLVIELSGHFIIETETDSVAVRIVFPEP